MKRFAAALFILLAPFYLSLQAQDSGIRLTRVTWAIDPECPGTGADDLVVVTLRPVDLGPDPEWTVELAHQTSALSCPHWTGSWSVSGGQTSFRYRLATEVHKAVRVRATWDGGSRDWILEPPDGGDTCFPSPEAPVCQE